MQILEGEIQLLEQQLKEQGIKPKTDYRHIELSGRIKAQKAKIKAAKKNEKANAKATVNDKPFNESPSKGIR